MLDFTSSLYLGLRHPSWSLRPWANSPPERRLPCIHRPMQGLRRKALPFSRDVKPESWGLPRCTCFGTSSESWLSSALPFTWMPGLTRLRGGERNGRPHTESPSGIFLTTTPMRCNGS